MVITYGDNNGSVSFHSSEIEQVSDLTDLKSPFTRTGLGPIQANAKGETEVPATQFMPNRSSLGHKRPLSNHDQLVFFVSLNSNTK